MCIRDRPNEKGHVERLLDFARRNFLVPVPRVDSLHILNDRLTESCRTDLERTLRSKPATKRELLDEECDRFFHPLPIQAFESHRIVTTRSNSLSLVRFDKNDYSVPTQFAHREITVVATVDEVKLVCEDRLVGRHKRCWKKQQSLFEPVHLSLIHI